MAKKKKPMNGILDNGGTVRIDKAIELTGLSGTYLKKLIRCGNLRTSKVGRSRLIIKADLEKLIKKGMK